MDCTVCTNTALWNTKCHCAFSYHKYENVYVYTKKLLKVKKEIPHEHDKGQLYDWPKAKKKNYPNSEPNQKKMWETFQSSRSGKSERIETKSKVEFELLFGTQALIGTKGWKWCSHYSGICSYEHWTLKRQKIEKFMEKSATGIRPSNDITHVWLNMCVVYVSVCVCVKLKYWQWKRWMRSGYIIWTVYSVERVVRSVLYDIVCGTISFHI